MSNIHNLKSKLARFAEQEAIRANGARELSAACAQHCLDGILNEIDETVLPRDLFLQNEHGLALRITAKNRRLIRLNAPIAREFATFSDLFGQDLALADATRLGRLCHILTSVCKGATRVAINATKATRGDVADEIGLTVAQLKSALAASDHDRPEPETEDSLGHLLKAHADECLGWLRLSGDVPTASGGGQEYTADLQHSAQRVTDFRASGSGISLRCWGFPNDRIPNSQAIVASLKDDVLVMLIPDSSANRFLATWRNLVA